MTPRRPGFRSFLTLACLIAVAAAFALSTFAPRAAEAHAILVRSDPPVNARLPDPPATVTGFFSESLDTRLSSLHVLDGKGDRVDAGETSFGPDPKQMSVAVTPQLPPGFYTAVWETLSSTDGHLLKGSFPFTVLNPDGSEPSGPRFAGEAGYSGGGPKWENVVTKWAGLVAAALLAGSLAFVIWIARPASKGLGDPWKKRARDAARHHLAWLAWPAIGVLALVGAAELLLQTRQLGGLSYIDDVLRNDWGTRWVQRQLVLVAIAGAFFLGARLWRAGRDRLSESALWVAQAGGLGYLLLVATTSHGSSVPGSFWAVAADFAHLVASSVWIGMLAQLALFLVWTGGAVPQADRPALQAPHLQRFSAIAATSVVILLASGAVNGLTQIPVPEAMFDTAYGRALTVKLGVMAALLVVAAVNAFYLRPRLVQEGGQSAERLSRRLSLVLRAEIGLGLAVLVAAAVLVQYPTSRQDRDAEANIQTSAQAVVGFEDIQPAGDVSVNLSIAPNVVGTDSFRVFLFPAAGGQIGEVQRVRLRFKPPDITQGESQIIADPAGLNAYKAIGPFFSQPGRWEVQVDLRRVEKNDVTAVFRLDVAGTGAATGGGRFTLPLVAGSWATVGAVGMLLAALLAAVWATQWPELPAPMLRPLRVGSGAVLVIGVAFLAVSLLPAGKTTGENPIEASGGSIAIGRSLYAQNCTQCHGVNGDGKGQLAPGLTIPPADFRIHIPYHTDKFFFQVIGNGLGDVMPGFASQLTEDERWHLINFLKSEFGIDASPAGQ